MYIDTGWYSTRLAIGYIKADRAFNFAAYTYIHLDMVNVTPANHSGDTTFTLHRDNASTVNKLLRVDMPMHTLGPKTLTYNISTFRTTFIPVFGFMLDGAINLERIRVD